MVIVGAGEVGPCGTARTRFAFEVDERLSDAAVLELAWVTGRIAFEESGRGGRWVDLETGDEVALSEVGERYREAVTEGLGIRFTEPAITGFDAEASPVLATAWLDRDYTFAVDGKGEADDFLRADPDKTAIRYDAEGERWLVTRQQGAEIRLPKQVTLSRRVLGMIPTGFDFARWGVPKEMVENVDRTALFNLISTVDAFINAGLTPEELLRWVHPARVANTQSSGFGGMRSLQRMYLDHLLGQEPAKRCAAGDADQRRRQLRRAELRRQLWADGSPGRRLRDGGGVRRRRHGQDLGRQGGLRGGRRLRRRRCRRRHRLRRHERHLPDRQDVGDGLAAERDVTRQRCAATRLRRSPGRRHGAPSAGRCRAGVGAARAAGSWHLPAATPTAFTRACPPLGWGRSPWRPATASRRWPRRWPTTAWAPTTSRSSTSTTPRRTPMIRTRTSCTTPSSARWDARRATRFGPSRRRR